MSRINVVAIIRSVFRLLLVMPDFMLLISLVMYLRFAFRSQNSSKVTIFVQLVIYLVVQRMFAIFT